MAYMPTSTTAERTVRTAARKAPATIRKPPQKRKHFVAYTVSQLLETYRDPRAVLMEIAGMDTAALAQLANCTMLDAIAERRMCAQAVLPYVAQKMPVQVDMKHSRAIHLNIVDDRAYQELVEISTEPVAPDEGMSLQLIGSATVEETDASESVDEHQQTGVSPTVTEQRASTDVSDG